MASKVISRSFRCSSFPDLIRFAGFRSGFYFCFRGLRKSRENCISVGSFLLLRIVSASLGYDPVFLIRAKSHLALIPLLPLSGQDPLRWVPIRFYFRFRGLRKSRENCIYVGSFLLLRNETASPGSDPVCFTTDDLFSFTGSNPLP